MGLPMTPSPMKPITSGTHASLALYNSSFPPFVELIDTVALITGGKRIGLVVARELAARGANVALSYARSRGEAEEAAAQVRAAGRRAEIFQTNLAVPEQCAALVQG